ncbi:MAG: hypothetical protein WCG81_10325 [Candidatus Angelobacter sp.]
MIDMNIKTQSGNSISPKRLWFGFAGSACAWIGLGIADLLITWRACLGEEQYGGAHMQPGFRALYIVVTLALFVGAIVAGFVSYKNWQQLSAEHELSQAEGRGRAEYMALAGVFISFTLGIGIIWLAIPIGLLNMCVRAR